MKKVKGFTLIELLIVVAIIAILAAIAVPNFLEAQIRSKVSRSLSDMRSLATAIESYMIDANQYPMSAIADDANTIHTGMAPTAESRLTFAVTQNAGTPMTLTTPVAYITSYPSDPFADTRGSAFMYLNVADFGWMLASYGPDTDEKPDNGDIQPEIASQMAGGDWQSQSIYNPNISNPTDELLSAGYTYDATNGSTSNGDVWRLKQ